MQVNRSGTDRPYYSPSGKGNTVYTTSSGKHVYVYDENGKLIYDISPSRVKSFTINTDPNGGEHFQEYKLKGDVPDFLMEKYGWK